MSHRAILLALLASSTGLAACDGFYLAPIVESESIDESHLAPARVNLPPVPRLDVLDAPRGWPDGTLSVAGLLLDRAALREADIRVTGIVQEIYVCEGSGDEIGEGTGADGGLAGVDTIAPTASVTRRAGCLLPHLYIVDNLRSSTRMLVADYDAFFYQPQLEVGGRYVFAGVFTDRARGFTSTEEGLIAASRIEGPGVRQPEELAAEATDAAPPR